MKHLSLILLLSLIWQPSAAAVAPGKHLFILAGQSNMVNLDPGVSFMPALAGVFGKESVIVVKDALDGQTIRAWYRPAAGNAPGRTGWQYERLMKKIDAATAGEKIRTVTLVWMQGERDAMDMPGEAYRASLDGLIGQLGKDLGRKEINFVIGRLSDYDMANGRRPFWTAVRDAQVEVAEAGPRGAWVDTDDLNDKADTAGRIRNLLHYTVDGYRVLGTRFARECIELINNPAPGAENIHRP